MDRAPASQDASIRISEVVESDLDGIADIFEFDVQPVAFLAMADILQHEIAIATGAGDLEGRFVEARTAPTWILFVFEHLVRIEGGDIAASLCWRKIRDSWKRAAPVEMLEFAVGRESHRIRAIGGGDQPDTAAFVKLDDLSRSVQREKQRKTAERCNPAHGLDCSISCKEELYVVWNRESLAPCLI